MAATIASLSKLVGEAYPNCNGTLVNFNNVEFTIYTQNGKLHREDGPALLCKDFCIWFCEGHIHCDTGPAFIWAAVKQYDWYFRGINVSESIEGWLDKYKLLPKDPQSWTGQHKVYFKLTFGGMVPE